MRVRRAHSRKREVMSSSAEGFAESDPDPGPGPEEIVSRAQARVLLDEILEAMDNDLRVVFVLFEIEQLADAEIAAALGIPVGTVKSRLRRAREDFQARVQRSRVKLRGRG
jgi:RNA polymerase sigma-70 factor (ECF subfamily)